MLAAEWGWNFADFLLRTNQLLFQADTDISINAFKRQIKSDNLVTVSKFSEQLSELDQRHRKIAERLATCHSSRIRNAFNCLMKDAENGIVQRQMDCRRQWARVLQQEICSTPCQVEMR